ncbi:nitroreductase family protein [Lacticaseibacillus parakribbianus]|uniref:nitroreductase family protein n=1 Tax=Lacticaseibacillus parakribbianus TaxID=2970927 RepID=UPI0021CB5DD5|nr:nitroreductase family protein [Lacticaseibacillus parakribbianus]
MNDTIQRQLNHRSVRRFTPQAVTAATVAQLMTVAQHTATSHYMQAFSVISVTAAPLRAEIAGISRQAYVNSNGQLFVFVADQHRAAALAQTADAQVLGSADKLLQAQSDALLAAENTAVAAESLGLGTVFLGSILNDPLRLIDLLKLPRYTFPVLGLLVGYPDQATQPKPRLPQTMMHFENGYDATAAVAGIADYDEVIRAYYANRSTNAREETFTHLLTAAATTTPAKRGELLAALHQQGFLLA